MSMRLKKYNKETQSWEIISPNSATEVYVNNPHYTFDGQPITLDNALTSINNNIEKLKRNVSWLAEHGGGGGVGGGSAASQYGIVVMNAGVTNNTLYVKNTSFTISFKITGGTLNDKIEYRVIYDGNYLVDYTQHSVNTNINVNIPNIDMYSQITPHTLIIEGVDADGMTIPSYTLSIVETSLNVETNAQHLLTIGGLGNFDIFITNKILNSKTDIKIINESYGNKEYTYSYTSTSTSAQRITIDFYKNLIDETNVIVGNIYHVIINAQTTTSDGIIINAEPISCQIMIQGSNKIVIALQNITTELEYNTNPNQGTQFIIGGNINFAFTPYLTNNPLIYYAVQLQHETSNVKINISGFYDLEEENKTYLDNDYKTSGTLVPISWNIPKDNNYLGVWLCKIKCWSANGLVVEESIAKCKFIESTVTTFPIQNPIRGVKSEIGNTQYAYWDFTNFPQYGKATEWVSNVFTYLPPHSVTNDPISVNTKMQIFNTNGVENGFLTSPYQHLRLSSESYATISLFEGMSDDERNSILTNDGFTISLTFKSDSHPYNNRTIFQMGKLDDNNNLISGIKIDLENIYWRFTTTDNNNNKITKNMQVKIKQNTFTAVDFVYTRQITANGTECVAKIFVNGIINAAVEANSYDTELYSNVYLGCGCNSLNKPFNYADVNILCCRIFTHYLNDIEIIINAHNALADRDENNNIIEEKYDEWKKRNFFIENDNSTKPRSLLFGETNDKYEYQNPGFASLIGSNPPLPVLWLDGSQSEFTKEFYETTSHNANVTNEKYGNFNLKYYDPTANNGKGVQIDVNDKTISISLQGTSTTTLRSKNLELYFTKNLNDYGDGRVQLFQPKDHWFPESQFTLKADVVDSAHANNATLGKWINEEGAKYLFEDTPPMKIVKSNPPKDSVYVNENNTFITKDYGHQTSSSVKHTLEGFQIILMITFKGKISPEMLGIYSFNLGRYSYYNMGLKMFKYFSRRILDTGKNEYIDQPTPALINYYDFYQPSESISSTDNSVKINMNEVFSFELNSDADDNTIEHNTWSQDSLSIIEHIGEFKYNGIQGNSIAPNYGSNPWLALQQIFYATARMPQSSKCYEYTESGAFVTDGSEYAADLNVASELLVKRLSIKNCMGYFIIANAFGMVDSLGKNLTLRSWNAKYDEDDTLDQNKWYPCFYDMDTALGLTNAGDESVSSIVYMDSYINQPINDINNITQPNSLIITRNDANVTNRFGAYNSKLWNILRSTSTNGDASYFKSSGKYNGLYYEGTWRLVREANAPLGESDYFIDLFTAQTQNCGELIYNQDYTIKYLTKYQHPTTSAMTYGNIEMLHGNRIEYIRNWLKDRFYFLDGVFEVKNVTDGRLPYYGKGMITCGGNNATAFSLLTLNSISPTILTLEIGQNGQIYKYFLPAYEDTTIALPPLSSDSKRVGINSTSLLTKIDGLKKIRFQKFESMSLPRFSSLDLSNVITFSPTNPIDFESVFTRIENNIITSDIREIDLSNTKDANVNDFPIAVSNYNKLRRINIENSCVTSLALPTAPLDEIVFNNSKIQYFILKKQPYITNLDFTNCNDLLEIYIEDCNSLTSLTINNLALIGKINILICNNLTTIICQDNKLLTNIDITSCQNLTSINLSGCTNINLQINILNVPKLEELHLQGCLTHYAPKLPNTSELNHIKVINLENCSNLTHFTFNDLNNDAIQYNGEFILDMRYFINLPNTALTLTNCSSLKYVKFHNHPSTPFILTNGYFQGCSSLKRVFGHINLNSNAIFKQCTYFQLLDKLVEGETIIDGCVQLPIIGAYDITTTENNGNVTNVSISTTNLSATFSETQCDLYDAYYILQKCDKNGNKMIINDETVWESSPSWDGVTNLSYLFAYCKNIKFTIKNSLNVDTFKYCEKVTTISNIFRNTSGETILYSPRIDANGNVINPGLFTYLPNCTDISTFTYGIKTYCDDKLFYKINDNVNLLINTITYFTPTFIQNSLNITSEQIIIDDNCYASSSNMFTYLPRLKTISFSFNNSSWYFKINQSINATDLFYNNPQLKTIKSSFQNITACGYFKNLFGGYEETITDTQHFPQEFSALTDSFIVSKILPMTEDGFAVPMNLLIGNSFLQKIKRSIVYFGSSTDTKQIFSGQITKYIDDEGSETPILFPYKVFNGCSELIEIPSFFQGLSRSKQTDEVITIPHYEDNGVKKSMFADCVKLTNVSNCFSDMNHIYYTLTSKGFINCNLRNVSNMFSTTHENDYETSNNYGNHNLQGFIPYGLFYQETTKNYVTQQGITKDTADALHLDESYGIKNCVFDENKNVIVKFDYEQINEKGLPLIISGNTEPDGNVYTINNIIYDLSNLIDDYGLITTITASEDNIKGKHEEEKSTFNGTYKTHKETIENISNLFQHSCSQNILPYTYNIANDITFNPQNKKYSDENIIIDNENYNPIYLLINPSYDPILYYKTQDVSGNIKYVINNNYDPRRFIKNEKYNPYPKKWNKWVSDGSNTIYNTIINSTLYGEILNGTHTQLPSELPEELCENYINQSPCIESDIPQKLQSSEHKRRLETRNYLVAPDLLRYCKNSLNTLANNVFYKCGGPDYHSSIYQQGEYLKYGFYGIIPPFIFEPINQIKELSCFFDGCNGILPFKWGENSVNDTGFMFSDKLLKPLTKIEKMNNLFSNIIFYNRCLLPNTLFIENTLVKNLSYLFAQTLWFDNVNKQIPETIFQNNKNIMDISFMFQSTLLLQNRYPKQISENLFTPSTHKSIEKCSEFLNYATEINGSVPRLWDMPNMKIFTNCYYKINTKITNYNNIPDNYKN